MLTLHAIHDDGRQAVCCPVCETDHNRVTRTAVLSGHRVVIGFVCADGHAWDARIYGQDGVTYVEAVAVEEPAQAN